MAVGYLSKSSKIHFDGDSIVINKAFINNSGFGGNTFGTAASYSGHSVIVSNNTTGELKIMTGSDLYTFQNGLTESSAVVELGGSLVKTTDIDFGNFNLSLTQSGSGNLIVDLTGTGNFIIRDTSSNRYFKVENNGDIKMFSTNHKTAGNYAFELNRANDEIFINNDIRFNSSDRPNTTLDNQDSGISLNIEQGAVDDGEGNDTITDSNNTTFTYILDNSNTTLNLPSVVGLNGRIIVIKGIGKTTTCTLTPNGSEAIDDTAGSVDLNFGIGNENSSIILQADETNTRWVVLAEYFQTSTT